jgi:KaiC/GvpD/RAD55 family RecA-like ATPase
MVRLRDLLHRDEPPAEQLPCPYPGLVPFGPEDAALFFGRDQESDEILRRIRQQNFLLVVGPSGSGKSSLVSAGVLPRLAGAGRWLVQTLRPAAGALAWLVEDELTAAVDALLDTVPGAERLLIVLDQAERAFLLPEKEERIRLLALLDRLRRVDRCVVLLTMRADFYADLMTSVLWPLERGERIEIAPLRGPALREAITRPAASAGVYFEAVLPERLLHDAGEEPGALSLVQEAMVLLWERMPRRLLTVSSYEALGGEERSGLAAALATRADAALSSLPRAQRPIARRIFVRLVRLGESRQDTRRAQPVSALRVPGEDPALFDSTLQHLTERRLVILSADDDEPVVDLGHEAMISHWPALGHWIEESRASELTRRRIERDSDDWQRGGRDRGDLYRRRKLADALELAGGAEHELSQNATRFLASGRRRRRLALLGVWIVAAGALSGIG